MLATPIEVKKAYKEGTHKKKYRFVVLNDDGTEDFTIDNDTLVAESVHIDERMATGSELKFGLCEGSSLEFQYFDHPNINGRQVQAFIDIYYDDVHTHSTPMGYFTVKECPRQFSTGIYKATAYNKLQSEYLDAEANEAIINIVSQGEAGEADASWYYILKQLLGGYNIETYNVLDEHPDIPENYLDDPTLFQYWLTQHAAQVNEVAFPIVNSSGSSAGYLHVRTFGFVLGELPQFDSNGYYTKFVLNSDVTKNITQSVYTANISSYLDNRYVRDYDTSDKISLRDFLLNGQCLTTRVVSSPTITFDMQKYVVGGQLSEQTAPAFNLITMQSDYETGVNYIGSSSNVYIYLPYFAEITNSSTTSASTADYTTYFIPLHRNFDWIYKMLELEMPELATQRITQAEAESFSDVTLRELQSAIYESACQYGQLDRQTDLFSGVELNGGGLYPAETLYPADGLYPNSNTGGNGIHPYPSEYSQLWTDTMGEQSFRYLIITYKTLDENNQEVDAVLQRTVNADGTTDYNMSDNWLFRNLVWTAADVGDYADAMVLKMQNIRWFPFEMWAAGLPYVETGDAIEITDREGNTHNSYILQRQLQGIQNLQDTYVNGELDIF